MRKERDAGRTRLLGVSNVSLQHLEQMEATQAELPAFVQNRCFARLGWDREVRSFCNQHNIIYQGFSLLTANREVLQHPPLIALAEKLHATPAQVVFSFARAVGMLPLTGTSNAEHMKQDLAEPQPDASAGSGASDRIDCGLTAALYENAPASAAPASVKNAHHPNTMANDVPRFTLLTQVKPIAVSASVQIMKISSADARL